MTPITVKTVRSESTTYTLDATRPLPPVLAGHLKMGGRNPGGVEIAANNRFFTIGGEPVLPVMAEFHFSRYPAEYWEEELLKMRACGVQIVSSYVFWLHHEELEGKFDWSGNLDLGKFSRLCGKLGLSFFPRPGPHVHAEARNGGLPDWVFRRCDITRSTRRNEPRFMEYVRRYYREVAKQLEGQLFKDGGPVIGLQVDNEYWYDGPGGGTEYILALKSMARDVGIDVPLYSITGWGMVALPEDEFIPFYGGYPDQPWAQIDDRLPPNPHYFFRTDERNDHDIGSDIRSSSDLDHLTYDKDRYPFAACEMGAGIHNTGRRRPVVSPADIAALNLTKIGCGSNLVGYFVFHGVSNPVGKLSFFNETIDTGMWCDLPRIGYDFRAPLGEFGEANGTYHELRLLNLFLNDFGDRLAPLPPVAPDRIPAAWDDCHTLRMAARTDGQTGFVFVNNHIRHYPECEIGPVRIRVALADTLLELTGKPLTVPAGSYFFWPFRMPMGGAVLEWATAQPLCILRGHPRDTVVFFDTPGLAPEFRFAHGEVLDDLRPGSGSIRTITPPQGAAVDLLLLSREEALRSYKFTIDGRDYLFRSAAKLYFDGRRIHVIGTDPAGIDLAWYPDDGLALKSTEDAAASVGPSRREGEFRSLPIAVVPRRLTLQARELPREELLPPIMQSAPSLELARELWLPEGAKAWAVDIPANVMSEANDVFLRISFAGDKIEAYLDGRLITDAYYDGTPWTIGLKRFLKKPQDRRLILLITPLRADAPVWLEDFAKVDPASTPRLDKLSVDVELSIAIEALSGRVIEEKASQ